MGALVLVVAIGTVAASGPAGATGGIVTCGSVNGIQGSFSQLYTCSDEPATGGSGSIPAQSVFSGTHTATIFWSAATLSQPFTTVIRITTHVVTKKKDPCPLTAPTELKVLGRVRSDTSGGVSVGGQVSAILCQTSGGKYALLAGSAFTL